MVVSNDKCVGHHTPPLYNDMTEVTRAHLIGRANPLVARSRLTRTIHENLHGSCLFSLETVTERIKLLSPYGYSDASTGEANWPSWSVINRSVKEGKETNYLFSSLSSC